MAVGQSLEPPEPGPAGSGRSVHFSVVRLVPWFGPGATFVYSFIGAPSRLRLFIPKRVAPGWTLSVCLWPTVFHDVGPP